MRESTLAGCSPARQPHHQRQAFVACLPTAKTFENIAPFGRKNEIQFDDQCLATNVEKEVILVFAHDSERYFRDRREVFGFDV